jgi:chemotaxis protein CheD
MAHVVLPDSAGNPDRQTPKFADVAVPELIRLMELEGALVRRTEFKLVGGAHMTPVAAPGDNPMNIGERNAVAVRGLLEQLNCKVLAEDLGGSSGRTVRLYVESGQVSVSTAGKSQKDL